LYLNKIMHIKEGRPANLRMPTGLLLYSPWVDLTLGTARNGLTTGHDDLINPSMSYLSSMQYMATVGDPSICEDPSSPFALGPFHPYFSPSLPSARPALAQLSDSYTPERSLRVLMYSSAAELLGPESRRLAENLEKVAGIQLEFHEEQGEVHCFPLIPTWISPAAKKALDRIEIWLKEEQAEDVSAQV
jgi:acetyl esterase/lipase